MSSNDSNSRSREIVKDSVSVINKVFNLGMNDSKINKLVIELNYPFRKICHFSEYFILSLFLLLSLRLSNINLVKSIIITLSFCILFSISDEMHQMYIDGRSPLVFDCFIDILGSSLFCFIYYIRTRKLS